VLKAVDDETLYTVVFNLPILGKKNADLRQIKELGWKFLTNDGFERFLAIGKNQKGKIRLGMTFYKVYKKYNKRVWWILYRFFLMLIKNLCWIFTRMLEEIWLTVQTKGISVIFN
jgi:hypothetical protein